MDMHRTCLLVSMTIHSFTNQRNNHVINNLISEKLNIATAHDRFMQALLPPESLAPVRTATNALRNTVRKMTYPWVDNMRIIPNARIFLFQQAFNEHHQAFDAAVSDIVAQYDNLLAKKKADTGDLFMDSLYPATKEEFASLFSVELSLYPLPNLDTARMDISHEIVEQAKLKWAAQVSTLSTSWINMIDLIYTTDITERYKKNAIIRLESLRKDIVEMFPTQVHILDRIDAKLKQLCA